MRCLVFRVEQIGNNQIGDLDPTIVFKITEWQPSLIVAINDDDPIRGYPADRIKSTLNIQGTSMTTVTTEWIEEPVNPTLPICKNTPNVIRKWSVEAPPFWKSLRR
jgi:hypothetical protein